jgi:hypothetical protein
MTFIVKKHLCFVMTTLMFTCCHDFLKLSILCMLHVPHFIAGLVTEGTSTQQCYMGICLPRELAFLYPREESTKKAAGQKDRSCPKGDSERQRSTSLGEMEDLQEAGLCLPSGCTIGGVPWNGWNIL